MQAVANLSSEERLGIGAAVLAHGLLVVLLVARLGICLLYTSPSPRD